MNKWATNCGPILLFASKYFGSGWSAPCLSITNFSYSAAPLIAPNNPGSWFGIYGYRSGAWTPVQPATTFILSGYGVDAYWTHSYLWRQAAPGQVPVSFQPFVSTCLDREPDIYVELQTFEGAAQSTPHIITDTCDLCIVVAVWLFF